LHNSSHAPEHYCSGTGAVSALLKSPARADLANLNSSNTAACHPACLVLLVSPRAALPETSAFYVPSRADSSSACCTSWPHCSLASPQQTNLPGHAGWLLRAVAGSSRHTSLAFLCI